MSDSHRSARPPPGEGAAERDGRPVDRDGGGKPPLDPARLRAAIAAALASPDAEERRRAISDVGSLAVLDAVPLLLRALGDADWRVRKEATVAARAFALETPLLTALVAALGPGDNVGLRNAAVDVLGAAGRAVTPLVAARLEGLDADGRKLAVEVLGRSRDPGALPIVERLSADGDANVRQASLEALPALAVHDRGAVAAILERGLDDRDACVRLAALEGLNHMGGGVAWERLERLLDEPELRAAAVLAAGLASDRRAAAALAAVLASSRGAVQAHALEALATLADGPLADAVGEALARRAPDVGPQLLALAAGPSDDTDLPPSVALGAGSEAAYAPDARSRALFLAVLAGVPGAVAMAVDALGEQTLSPHAQRALAAAGADALPELVRRFEAGAVPADPDARAALVEAIGAAAEQPDAAALGSVEPALGALRRAARDAEPRVATSALFILSRLGTSDDLALCAELGRADDPAIANTAEGALSALASRHPAAARGRARAESALEPSFVAALVVGALGPTREAVLGSMEGDLAFLTQAATTGDARARRVAVAAVGDAAASVGAEGIAPAALDLLGFALADEERSVQLAAARALGRLCARAAREESYDDASSERAAGKSSSKDRLARSTSDVLELVSRSRDDDLVAATVRALGDATVGARRSLAPPPLAFGSIALTDELVQALAPLAHGAPATVAIAAVEALGRTPSEVPGRFDALAGALSHVDPAVVRAAILKLGSAPRAEAALGACLEHPSPEVRALAVERISELGAPSARERLVARLDVEHDEGVRRALALALSPEGIDRERR